MFFAFFVFLLERNGTESQHFPAGLIKIGWQKLILHFTLRFFDHAGWLRSPAIGCGLTYYSGKSAICYYNRCLVNPITWWFLGMPEQQI